MTTATTSSHRKTFALVDDGPVEGARPLNDIIDSYAASDDKPINQQQQQPQSISFADDTRGRSNVAPVVGAGGMVRSLSRRLKNSLARKPRRATDTTAIESVARQERDKAFGTNDEALSPSSELSSPGLNENGPTKPREKGLVRGLSRKMSRKVKNWAEENGYIEEGKGSEAERRREVDLERQRQEVAERHEGAHMSRSRSMPASARRRPRGPPSHSISMHPSSPPSAYPFTNASHQSHSANPTPSLSELARFELESSNNSPSGLLPGLAPPPDKTLHRPPSYLGLSETAPLSTFAPIRPLGGEKRPAPPPRMRSSPSAGGAGASGNGASAGGWWGDEELEKESLSRSPPRNGGRTAGLGFLNTDPNAGGGSPGLGKRSVRVGDAQGAQRAALLNDGDSGYRQSLYAL